MLERAWCEVNLDAIPHNLQEIKKLVGNTKIMGIVKADAYGHGAVSCSKAMEAAGVDFFAVATLPEALELRQAGIRSNILILGWTAMEDMDQVTDHDLIQTIISPDYGRQLAAWGKAHGKKVRTHMKVDTGMNRIGLAWKDENKEWEAIRSLYLDENLAVEGIFSHYPVSDDLTEEAVAFTDRQTANFLDLTEKLRAAGIDPGIRHIQNSYGILNYGDLGMDYCRPGLLYMGVTSDDAVPIRSNPDFQPILSLKTVVTMVKTIQPGETVSYGRHFRAERPTKIASLAIGYADGLPRLCSNKQLEVLIDGHRVPLAGNICMDQCMADVTGLDIRPGMTAVIIGCDGKETVTVDQLSRLSNTINNETLTRITRRVPRKEMHAESKTASIQRH